MPKQRAGVGKQSWPFIVGLFLSAAAAVSGIAQVDQAPEAASGPALVLAVAVDEAGISAGDLERSRSLILALWDVLPPDSQMMLSRFVGEQRVVLPPTSDRPRISEALDGLKGGSAAAVAVPDGLFDTVRALARHKAGTRVVLLVSAGHEREGDLQFEDPLNEATSNGISVFTLAVGQGDGKLLRRISKVTGGDSFRLEVADASLLSHAILSRIAGANPASPVGADPSPQVEPTPATSTGLLTAVVALALLAALLFLAALVLLGRRLRRRPVPPPAKAPADVDGVDAEAKTLILPDASQVSSSSPRITPAVSIDEEDVIVEHTLFGTLNPTLLGLSGPGTGKNFPLSPTGKTSLGRSRRNDIVVPEDAASAQHCRIDREGETYVLYDLTSTNGTWLNDVRTERAILKNGDRLKVGDTLFAVSLFSGT